MSGLLALQKQDDPLIEFQDALHQLQQHFIVFVVACLESAIVLYGDLGIGDTLQKIGRVGGQ